MSVSVYTEPFTDILGKDKPLISAKKLIILMITAQKLLVLLFKSTAVYMVICIKRTGGRRPRLHTLLLKKRKFF